MKIYKKSRIISPAISYLHCISNFSKDIEWYLGQRLMQEKEPIFIGCCSSEYRGLLSHIVLAIRILVCLPEKVC